MGTLRRGQSLVEIGLATALMVALASAVGVVGSAAFQRGLGQKHVEQVKDLQQAIERYCEKRAERGGISPIPTAISQAETFRYNPNLTFPGTVFNPYTEIANQAVQNVSAGIPNTGYELSTNYPKAATRGYIYYFMKTPATNAYFKVWNGVAEVYFRSYALQALDDNGYPLITVGR